MMTALSLFGVYFASYVFDYVIILVILMVKHFCEKEEANYYVWGILIGFIILSFFIINRIRKTKMNTRIRLVPNKNITHKVLGYLPAQIITVATTLFTDWWVFIDVMIFLVFGVFFVKSKAIHTSPLFVIPLGNRIYQAGDDVIITKYSLQEIKIEQEDHMDGLEARELTNRIYYVRKK